MTTKSKELVFVALGGLGEIGMNVYLYGVGSRDDRQWLMVDLGITFPGEFEPGVDIILPDLRFIQDERNALSGIVITHAHEDHIGAVIELWPSLRVPLYMTGFAEGMLRSRLAEYGRGETPEIRQVPRNGQFQVGEFALEFVPMSHSIPETSGLVLRTSAGTVFHTADWKLDLEPFVGEPTDEGRIVDLGREGIDVLVCDSTNALRDGRSPSETEVAASLSKIISQQSGRVVVTTFSSNVARIKAVADAAKTAGRELVVAGRALHRVIGVAIENGYLPLDFQYLDQEHAGYLAPDEALILATGSQGESRAALARIALGEHRDIQLGAGDTVIYSSRTIPGNEKRVLATQNRLAARGVKIISDAEGLVHVTGHPRKDELVQMFNWTRPTVMVPMHGETRHLKENARLARLSGISNVAAVSNGQLLRLAPGEPKIVDEVPVGRYFRDGRLIVAEGSGAVGERRKLAHVGIVVVALALNTKGEVLGDIDVSLDGIPGEDAQGEAMENIVLDAVDGTIDSIPRRRRRETEMIREAVRRSVRSAVDRAWGKRPIVKVLVNVASARV
ncbi:MAG: ribonuclease J [Hyphomicrobiaceae bacterium]